MIVYMQQTLGLIETEHPELVEQLSGKLEQVITDNVVYYRLIE